MLTRHTLDDGSPAYCIVDKAADGRLQATIAVADQVLHHHGPFASLAMAREWMHSRVPAHKSCSGFTCPNFQMHASTELS